MTRHGKLLTGMLCAIAIIGLAVAAVPAQDQAPAAAPVAGDVPENAAPDIPALQAEIQVLRERITRLEERLAELEGGIQPLEFRYTPVPEPGPQSIVPPAAPGRTPHGEINGVPYYVIPLGKE